LINESVAMWLNEFNEVTHERLLWNLVKYRIRQVSIKYSKEKAHEKRKRFLISRLLFSHGTSTARGVAVLIKNKMGNVIQ